MSEVRLLTVAAMIVAVAAAAHSAAAAQEPAGAGKEMYDRWCAECHGYDGKGDGSAASRMLPRPRDFTPGVYQIRTTASGELPTDEDVFAVIRDGVPGTAMPGWRSKLSDAQMRDLVSYIKTFSRFFEQMGAPEPLEFGSPPRGGGEEAVAEGRRFYEEIECWKCHGDAGRGDGPSAPTLQDDLDFPIRATDLSENWNFNGGGSVEAIYRRLRTGLDGTPMPSFSDLLAADFMTEEQLWHLAQYVRSLSPERPPHVREAIAAARVEGELPAAPDDSGWADVERFYIPLVGQIIEESRWFAPTVDGVWVQALHNDEELALRLVWHDPSESPDRSWLEWQDLVARAMYPPDDSVGVTPLPDRFAVQYPTSIPRGRERPYFLMGDRRRPVYLWQWASQPAGAVEQSASGLGSARAIAGEGSLESQAVWDAGEWRLVLRRAFASPDTSAILQFEVGESIPIAFFAWDGSNGESGSRMSVSTWYSIFLERATPATVYISPVLAILLTVGLGMLVVWRAQSRGGAADGPRGS
jgi:DMSO reductase family type II enzyme heme b subunit